MKLLVQDVMALVLGLLPAAFLATWAIPAPVFTFVVLAGVAIGVYRYRHPYRITTIAVPRINLEPPATLPVAA